MCCIVSNLCIYTTATAVAANIKEKNRVRFRSNRNEPLVLLVEGNENMKFLLLLDNQMDNFDLCI